MVPLQEGKWSLSHPFTKKKPKLLLVEGEDEWHLLIRLLEPILGVVEIDVRSFAGRDNLSRALRSLREGAASGFDYVRALGVCRDADEDPDAAFHSVCTALRTNDFTAPEQPGAFADGKPRVGVLILPDRERKGSLDTILRTAAAGEETMGHCVSAYIECLKGSGLSIHPNTDKVWVHAYLASRPNPSLKLGEAAKAGCWNFNHEAWEPIKQFIHAM